MLFRHSKSVYAGVLIAIIAGGGMTPAATQAAGCPAVTVANMQGVATGAFLQQYELAEYEAAAGCTLSFSENPDVNSLNSRILGNGSLPSVGDRLPDEPLVVAPYDSIGKYGGTFDMISNATEAGTSDLLSTRHVNFVRFSDDLQTIVPNVAKSWSWNDDFTQLTFNLRKGHKWSDGQPFTSADVVFWYHNLNMDTNIIEKAKAYLLVGGEPMTVDAIDETTVRFTTPAPYPGLLAHFASHYGQGFQPKHFLGQFHPEINPEADALAKAAGFEKGYDVVNFYYGQSDWTDVPSPMLRDPSRIPMLPAAIQPSLESYVTISDTTEGRHYVANPYFHMVDTTGQQLPYISEQDEIYINDHEVRILKAINGEYDYKVQSLALPSVPVLLDNQENGGFTVDLSPEIAAPTLSFNVTSADLEKRKVFGDLRFRQAMSVAINRAEINQVAFFDLGRAQQYIGFSPPPSFVDPKWLKYYAQFDQGMANKLLDEVGVVDKDGDGNRELPNGDALVINIQFATQGVATEVVELIAQHWSDVGVKTTSKEVTPDEFRSAQSANQLDITIWRKGQPLAIILGNNELFLPPFENYFGSRNGMLWAEYVDSGGSAGVKPPAYVDELIADIAAFQSTPASTPESDAIGARLVQNMTENLLFIGTVLAPAPIYHRNALKNFTKFKTASYEYYRTYPYRAHQWYLDE